MKDKWKMTGKIKLQARNETNNKKEELPDKRAIDVFLLTSASGNKQKSK